MSSNTSNRNEATPYGQAVLALATKVDNKITSWKESKATKTAMNNDVKPEIDAIKAFGRGALDHIFKVAIDNPKAMTPFTQTGYPEMKAKGRGLNASQHIEVAKQAWALRKNGLADGLDFGTTPTPTPATDNDPFADTNDPFADEHDPLVAMMMADAETDATIEADYIPYDRIMQIFNDKAARAQAVNTCFMAYMADANLDNNGVRCTFYNGTQRPKTGARITDLRTFTHKVLGMSWFNLAGIASVRGDDLASKNVLLGIPRKDENGKVLKDDKGEIIRMDIIPSNIMYSFLYAIVAVEAGVKKFNHDLRKYISDETISKIRDLVIDTSDLSHDSAPSNGWNLPYQRGKKQGERMSLDDLLGSDITL